MTPFETKIQNVVKRYLEVPNPNKLVHYPAYQAFYSARHLVFKHLLRYPTMGSFPLGFLTAAGRLVLEKAVLFARPPGRKRGGSPRFKGGNAKGLYLKWELEKVDELGLQAFEDWLKENGYVVTVERMCPKLEPGVERFVKFTIS
jgi:hypothetical protein